MVAFAFFGELCREGLILHVANTVGFELSVLGGRTAIPFPQSEGDAMRCHRASDKRWNSIRLCNV